MANTWTTITAAQRKKGAATAKVFGSLVQTVAEARDALDKALFAAVIHAADHGDTTRYLQIMQSLGQATRPIVQRYVKCFAPIYVSLDKHGNIIDDATSGQSKHGKLRVTDKRSKEDIDGAWDIAGLLASPYSTWKKAETKSEVSIFGSAEQEKLIASMVKRLDKIIDGKSNSYMKPRGLDLRRAVTKRNTLAELCNIPILPLPTGEEEEDGATHPMADAA